MKKIKVILLISDLGMGGAENIVINIGKYLNREKFDFKIVSMFSEEQCAEMYRKIVKEFQIPIVFLDKKPGLDLNIVYKLIKFFNKESPDIIHTHRYSCIYSIIPSVLCRIKRRIHTVHNVADKELPVIYQKIMKIAYKYLNYIPVAITPVVHESIENVYRLDKEKILIINNGIELNRFYNNRKFLDKSEYKLINIARFSEQKNHKLLLDSFEKLKKSNLGVRLTLIGDGVLKTGIVKRVEKLGLNDFVEFKGNVGDVETYLRQADIFVLTSDYEGLPLCVIEAMASGLPIVSTKAGGVVSLVKDGVNGFLVEIGDGKAISEKIILLLNDYKLRESMSKESIKMAQKYSVENMVAEYEKLYLN